MSAEALTPRDSDEALAAELAFGLLEGAERHAAEDRAAADPEFASAVACWEQRAAGLLAGPDEVPRPSLWAEIARRLPANDDAMVAPASAARRPGLWPWAAAVSAAAAIVLGVIALRPAPPIRMAPPVTVRAAPSLVAVLRATTGHAMLTVAIDRTDGRMTTAPVDLALAGHDAELWMIPGDGKPRSLGVVDPAAPRQRTAPAVVVPMLAPGVTLAVSVEPHGGSPTGMPTGAVIMTGKIAAV